jgi:hypothetical protein
MHSVRRDDTGNGVTDGNAKPGAEAFWAINVNGWRVPVPVSSHQTKKSRKSKGVITMGVCDEYLGDFARLDATCALYLELNDANIHKRRSRENYGT